MVMEQFHKFNEFGNNLEEDFINFHQNEMNFVENLKKRALKLMPDPKWGALRCCQIPNNAFKPSTPPACVWGFKFFFK